MKLTHLLTILLLILISCNKNDKVVILFSEDNKIYLQDKEVAIEDFDKKFSDEIKQFQLSPDDIVVHIKISDNAKMTDLSVVKQLLREKKIKKLIIEKP